MLAMRRGGTHCRAPAHVLPGGRGCVEAGEPGASAGSPRGHQAPGPGRPRALDAACLLYTSDAADDM
eukprot:6957092-Alexandrium_andersonii.AAC.1